MDKRQPSLTLKRLRERAGLTQSDVASHFGKKQQTIASWENGQSQPDVITLFSLCRLYNADISSDFGFSTSFSQFQLSALERAYLLMVRALDDSGRALVKMVIDHEHERCSAPAAEAVPSDDDSNVVNLTGLFPHLGLASAGPGALAQDAPVDWEQRSHAPRGATATMTIKGHSMEPLYHDGDLIWVDTTRPAEEGEIGVFAVDGQTYCKRLRYVDGRAVLESINPACGNITVTQDDARQIGRVVQK